MKKVVDVLDHSYPYICHKLVEIIGSHVRISEYLGNTIMFLMIIMNRLLQPRPPLYNPEDYAMSLKKWSRRAEESKQPPSIIALSTPQPGEMSLRQFASVTDLLNKLKMDLKLALARYISFIYVNIHYREQQQRKANH